MGRILNVAAIVALLLVLARPAWATLGMCTVTGTVYKVDGSVAANGDINFRLPSTQTFSADSVQTSLEAVKLDSGGNIPAGTQVPLGARIFIQVNNDKPVSVVVTNNPLNCPLAFGTLYGSSAGGVPIPSTVITSISTINNIPGITDTAVNPPGAGPATLTLNDQLPTTFGSTTQQPDLSGASYGGLLSIFSNLSFGPFLQLVQPATGAGTTFGQLTWGSPNTTDAEQRAAVIQVISPSSAATHANGQMNFFLTNGSGTSMGTLGPLFTLAGPTTTGNGPYSAQINNLGTGSNTQAYFQAQASGVFLFEGQRSSTYSLGDVPAGYGFLEESGGGNGLYIVSDATVGDEGIHFAANGQIAAGNLQLTEDSAGNFFWQLPGVNLFFRNANNSMNVEADNTYNTAGGVSQAGFFVGNSNGIIGGFSAIGNSSTGFGAPYFPNTTYVNSDAGSLLLYSGVGSLNLAADGQGAAGTLQMTEDASNNIQFEPTNTTGFVRYFGGGTGQPALVAQSTGNNSNDTFQILPQNNTQGIGFDFNDIHEIGSAGNNSLGIDAQAGGRLNLNALSPSNTWTGSFSSMGTVNNHHIYSSLDGGNPPSISTCTGGTIISGSTDVSGGITFSSATSSCLINFGAGWAATPNCTCSAEHGVAGTACGTNMSTSQLQMFLTVSSGDQLHWLCIGISDGPAG